MSKGVSRETVFLNALYVTDRELSPEVTIWRLSGEHFEGASARLKGKTIVFVMCDPDTGGIALPAQPARNAEYYVAGLAAGN